MPDSTIILSRSGEDSPDRRRFEAELLEHLVKLRAPKLLVIPSMYWLKDPSSALDALRAARGNLILATWMQPRATYWILRYHGIEGQISSQHIDNKRVIKHAGRSVYCFNLANFDSPETCVHALLEASGVQRRRTVKTQVESIDEELPSRWYPVIDDSLCRNCKQCLDFCLFGVYELDGGERVRVTNPDSCKPGCPACARVCPAGAIMFPEYEADPRIAGATDVKPTREFPEDQPESSPGDELDELIDELDELDEQESS